MSKQKQRRSGEKAKTSVTVKEQLAAEAETAIPEHDEVAALAYRLWLERGSPFGSDQEDWFRAEEQLNNRKVRVAAASSGV